MTSNLAYHPIQTWGTLALISLVIAVWKYFFTKPKTYQDKFVIILGISVFCISVGCTTYFWMK
jgi:hypothetical protein